MELDKKLIITIAVQFIFFFVGQVIMRSLRGKFRGPKTFLTPYIVVSAANTEILL